MKPYIKLNNNKVIKVKDINILENRVTIILPLKYFNYFSSEETALKEGFFKGWFTRSNSFNFNSDIAPEYEVCNGLLRVLTETEEL